MTQEVGNRNEAGKGLHFYELLCYKNWFRCYWGHVSEKESDFLC